MRTSSAALSAQTLSNPQSQFYLKGAQYKGRLTESLLCWTIEQTFVNSSDQAVELQYAFPLHSDAVVLKVSAKIGDREFHSQIKPKTQAAMDYQDQVAEGNSAILIELNSERQYEITIGNILPGETLVVSYETAQILRYQHGSARVVLPTTIAAAYSVGESHRRFELDFSDQTRYAMQASLELDGGLIAARVSSPSHKITFQGGATLKIQIAGESFLNKDFVLQLDGLGELSPVGLLVKNPFAKNPDSDVTAMASKVPGNYIGLIDYVQNPMGLTADGHLALLKPVELKILIDCSGSMGGDVMDSARSALKSIVEQLSPVDRISLSRFGSEVNILQSSTTPATARLIKTLHQHIDETDANMGGTEMAKAIQAVAKIPSKGPSDILLITDGEVDGLDTMVSTAVNSQHRLFIVAIGCDAKESLLSTVAQQTGGAVEFVTRGEFTQEVVERLFLTLRGSSFNNLQVDHPMVNEESFTREGFAHEGCSTPLFFTAEKAVSAVVVKGREVNLADADVSRLSSIPMRLIEDEELAKTVVRLMAAKRVENLTHQARMNSFKNGARGMSPTDSWLDCTAEELAVSYQLMSRYTSALLTLEREDTEKPDSMPLKVQVPQMVAEDGAVYRTGYVSGGSSSDIHCVSESIGFPALFRSSKGRPLNDAVVRERGSKLLDIPAFLRREADDYDIDKFYRLESPSSMLVLLGSETKAIQTLQCLLDLGVPSYILDELKSKFADILAQQGEAELVLHIIDLLKRGMLGDSDWQIKV